MHSNKKQKQTNDTSFKRRTSTNSGISLENVTIMTLSEIQTFRFKAIKRLIISCCEVALIEANIIGS